MAKSTESTSLFTKIAEAFVAMKISKGVFKYGIAPAALAGLGYFIYTKVKGGAMAT